MATQELFTRIALKYDTYENWKNSELVLLPGEIGLCAIPKSPADGSEQATTNPTVLFKVGDGTTAFKNLKWASALAADVYNWAKAETVEVVEELAADGRTKTGKKELVFRTDNEIKYRVDLSTFATMAELGAISDEVNAIKDALGIGEGSTGDETVQGQIVAINERLDSIIGTENTDGLIEQAESRINDKLGDGFDATNTVAKAITAAETNAKAAATTAIENLSKANGAIYTVEQKVNAIEDKVNLAAGETVTGKITEAISALDSTVTGSGKFITSVTQTDGKVAVEKGSIALADLPTLTEAVIPEIHTSKVIVTDAQGSTAKVTLDGKLSNIDTQIKGITDAIAGGVHFRGTVSDTEDLTDNIVTINGSSYTADKGDVILQGTKEFIWTGSKWEPLGDITRLGALEEKVGKMDLADSAVTNQFVTAVSQEDGKITVSRARPAASDIKYNDTSVADELGDVDLRLKAVEDDLNKLDLADGETVTGKITAVVNALDSTVNGSGAFVTAVTQENGKVTVTKGDLPVATDKVAGIVTLGATGGAAAFDIVDALSKEVENTVKSQLIAGLDDRTTKIEADYARINEKNELVMGTNGANVIIFNCGSASECLYN